MRFSFSRCNRLLPGFDTRDSLTLAGLLNQRNVSRGCSLFRWSSLSRPRLVDTPTAGRARIRWSSLLPLVELVETFGPVQVSHSWVKSGSDDGGVRFGFSRVQPASTWFRYARLADARRATQPAEGLLATARAPPPFGPLPLVELVETPQPSATTSLVE